MTAEMPSLRAMSDSDQFADKAKGPGVGTPGPWRAAFWFSRLRRFDPGFGGCNIGKLPGHFSQVGKGAEVVGDFAIVLCAIPHPLLIWSILSNLPVSVFRG
jgi:hypothetical protein